MVSGLTKFTLFTASIFVSTSMLVDAVRADQLPQRKPGLWEMAISSSQGGVPAQTMKQCIDSATDTKMLRMGSSMAGQMGANCSGGDVKSQGGKFVSDSICTIQGTKMTAHTEFGGDFNKAYGGITQVKYEPPLMGLSEAKTEIAAKWVGPCEADQKPGDMIMPGGVKMNIESMAAMAEQMNKSLKK